MLDLSIIVISYNTKDLLLNCLLSVKKNEPKDMSYELIVVDNASVDGSVEEISNIKDQKSNMKIIKNKENLGFSKANNQGMKIAKGEFILLLNSDTVILENAIDMMIQFMKQHQNAGVVGGKLKGKNGEEQPSTGPFLGFWHTLVWLVGGEKIGLLRSSPRTITNTDWVSGAFFMVRKEVLRRAGALDEHFFMYLEEMEWCYRIKRSGFDVYFLPEAKATHVGLGSSNRSFAIINIYKGIQYFYKKHKSPLELFLVRVLLKSKALIAMSIGLLTNNAYLKNTYGKAFAAA